MKNAIIFLIVVAIMSGCTKPKNEAPVSNQEKCFVCSYVEQYDTYAGWKTLEWSDSLCNITQDSLNRYNDTMISNCAASQVVLKANCISY